MLEIVSFTLGLVATNTFLVADTESGEAVIIDPAWYDPSVMAESARRKWHVRQIWVTHGHFDHFAGVTQFAAQIEPAPVIALHAEDLPLWQSGGGAEWFGVRIPPPAKPNLMLGHGQILRVGKSQVEVRHVPGHSPGHVVFYCVEQSVLFCGDTVFMGSVGRTDLPGGNTKQFFKQIRDQIMSLPEDTRLLPGHGEETTLRQEKRWNPFLTEDDLNPDISSF